MAELAALASPNRLAAWLGVPDDDPRMLAALDAASARFRGAVRHPVSRIDGDTVTVDGTGTRVLLLPAAPVTAVTAVTIDSAPVDDYDWSTAGIVRRRGGWPDRFGAVTVTYDHGYDPVPDDIAEAVLDAARGFYTSLPGLSQVQTGAEQVSFAAVGVTQQWAETVDAYRLNRGDRA